MSPSYEAIKLVGWDVLQAYLAKMSKELDGIAIAAVDEVGDAIVFDAKSWVRVDTGSLQKSIRKQKVTISGGFVRMGVSAGGYIVNPKTHRLVDYAIYVEGDFPFLRPAVLAHGAELVQALKWRMSEVK